MRGSTMVRRAGAGLVVLFVLAGCGGGDDGSSTDDTEAPEATLTSAGEDLDELFQDAFEDDENGWGEGEGEGSISQFTDGGFEVAVLDDNAEYWGYAEDGPLDVEDSSTTVEVAEGAGEADRWFGTTCRLSRTGPLAYYALLVNGATGGWTILRWAQAAEDPEILGEGVDDAVEGAGQDDPVAVTGTCLGGAGGEVKLAVAVDGTEVGAATDEEGLGAGISGLGVAPLEGDDGDEPVIFTGIEVRGDEGDADVELEVSFTDESSGFIPVYDNGNVVSYDDFALRFDLAGSADAPVPIRSPIPDAGTATAWIDGDLTDGLAGFCLPDRSGEYVFTISGNGDASIGFHPADGEDMVLLEEVTEAYRSTGGHWVSAGWGTNGEATNLELRVDGELVTWAYDDDRLASFTQLSLCGSVAGAEGEDATMSYTYDDLAVVGNG